MGTGHSLGAGLATLAATELRLALKKRASLAVCTFGSPKVGNRAFVRLFQAAACSSVRVVCDMDPISSMAYWWQAPLEPYHHVQGLLRIYHNGHIMARPNFLEEALRVLYTKTMPNYCCCLLFCPFAPSRRFHHSIGGYCQALRVAELLEALWEKHPHNVGVLTSFRPHISLSAQLLSDRGMGLAQQTSSTSARSPRSPLPLTVED